MSREVVVVVSLGGDGRLEGGGNGGSGSVRG